MLYSLGGVRFEVVAPNVHEVEATGETAFAEKPIAGGPTLLEHVGEGVGDARLTGKLFPKKFGGLSSISTLHALRRSGNPQFLMRGDGVPVGWYVITKVTEKSTYLAADGVGQVVDFTVDLKASPSPGAMGLFRLLTGFL